MSDQSDTNFKPYIGITDFMTRDQTLEALGYFHAVTRFKMSHKLMVGVMMSYKTLHKQPTKWAGAFPKSANVSEIFVSHPLAFNTLHYADYTNSDVAESIAHAILYGGVNLHALQLDMVWPDKKDIATTVVSQDRPISVILQVGSKAMAEVDDDPIKVIQKLRDYGDTIDGVLFDKSMGQGKPMDAQVLMPYVEEVYEHLPRLRVAVAGGLGPDTMHVVEPIVARFPDISIDAQERLRPSGSALDPIDWELANKYLEEASKMFAKHRPDPWDLLIS